VSGDPIFLAEIPAFQIVFTLRMTDETRTLHFSERIELNQRKIPVKHIPVKRVFDLLFSLAAILLLSPLFLLIALCIRLTSKGPVIFSHERIGRGGKRFRCYKFRTMYEDAERRLQDLLKSDPSIRQEWETNYKLQKDPRVTRVGKFLRKSSLDELPQFFNVLRGDLSVVGPRPVTLEEIRRCIGPYTNLFLSIRPGITGPWQVNGRSNTCYGTRIEMDLDYVQNHSITWDIGLILRTIPAVLFSRGAY